MGAIETYAASIGSVEMLRGASLSETLVLRCFANQAQCFMKLEKFKEGVFCCNYALTVPSVAHETHLWSKLLLRRSAAFEKLNDLESALSSLDSAIGLGVEVPENLANERDRLISRTLYVLVSFYKFPFKNTFFHQKFRLKLKPLSPFHPNLFHLYRQLSTRQLSRFYNATEILTSSLLL